MSGLEHRLQKELSEIKEGKADFISLNKAEKN